MWFLHPWSTEELREEINFYSNIWRDSRNIMTTFIPEGQIFDVVGVLRFLLHKKSTYTKQ